MKKIILLLIVFIVATRIFSQGVIKITPGTTVKSKKAVYLVTNKMNVVNNGILQQEQNDGTIKFTGTTNDSISGNGVTIINHLNLSKSSGTVLSLKKNISVRSACNFSGGSLNLDNYEMDLGSTAVLTNESELSRAFTTGTGSVKANVLLNSPSGTNPGNLGAIISSPQNPGNTIIRRSHKFQENLFGTNNSIKRYFDIQPANNSNLNATLRVNYFDGELNSLNESTLSQWKSSNNINWVSVCTNIVNTTANYVESSGINSFSRWTLATSTPPLNATILTAYAVNPGGYANTIYIGYGPSSITLNAQVMGGAPPYTYKWTIGSSAGPALNTTASYAVSPTTTTIYYLNVKDAFGCSIAVLTRQVNVVDIRCGAKLDKVTVCKFQNGNYSTVCVTNGTVAGLLSGGSYLGPCNSPVTLATPIPEKDLLDEKVFDVKVFPNPSNKFFTLNIESDEKNENIKLEVFDVNGKQVELRNNVYGKLMQIGQNYFPGIYFVKINWGGKSKTIKLVKL